MKKLFLIPCLFLIVISSNGQNDCYEKYFLRELAPKLYGLAFFDFIIIKDSTKIIQETFRINFIKDSITLSNRMTDSVQAKIKIDSDCRLLLGEHNVKYYNSSDFKTNNFNNTALYNLIDKDFLNFSNERKLDLLINLSNKYFGTGKKIK